MTRGETGKTHSAASLAKTPIDKRAASLRDKLEQAAQGLRHLSESDYPYHFFCLPWDAEQEFTLENFLFRLGISQAFLDDHHLSIDDIASERPFEEFILGYQDPDDPEAAPELKQRQKLIKVLKDTLKEIKVIRVGTVQISCYVAGIDEQGDIVGLLTTAIET